MEPKEIEFQTIPSFGKACTAIIPRAGDILVKLYLKVNLGPLGDGAGGSGVRYVDDVGRAMIDSVSIKAGSVTIDTLYPEFMHAWEEISTPSDLHLGQATGKASDDALLEDWAKSSQHLYIPLEFYFHRHFANGLPLVSLYTTTLSVVVNFKPLDQLVSLLYKGSLDASKDGIMTAKLIGEFVTLATPERMVFLEKRHQFIMSQVQKQHVVVKAGTTKYRVPLQFSLPCKEFIILPIRSEELANNNWFNFKGYEESVNGGQQDEGFHTLAISLNSCLRVQPRDPMYYRIIQNSVHHRRVPRKVIYSYSLAIEPESYDPSGSLNMSRIDDVSLEFTFSAALPSDLHFLVFARSINVFKAYAGLSSLKWAS